MNNKKYLSLDGGRYTIEEMVDRVVYWWKRYEGTRTEDGKDYSVYDIVTLSERLNTLYKNPAKFNWNHPDMNIEEYCNECGDELNEKVPGNICHLCNEERLENKFALEVKQGEVKE